MSKICSKCNVEKPCDNFISQNRRICKPCSNVYKRNKINNMVIDNTLIIKCIHCETEKTMDNFIKATNTCKDCNNAKRRNKYKTDNEHRIKLIQLATNFKHNKVIERNKIKEEKILLLKQVIGEDNEICKYCNEIRPITNFRYNRKKCKDCEREDPYLKLTRCVRNRIYIKMMNKSKHSIEYLGCNYDEYFKWIFSINPEFTMENHGTIWHIDHVIPLSHFNMENEEEQLIAFNWRNTTPLLAKENLIKNNKIILEQIREHYKKLVNYHKFNNIELPEKYIYLFAKHLDDGDFLKPLLPLTDGNVSKELG